MLSSHRLLEGRRIGLSDPILQRRLLFTAMTAVAFATACTQEQDAPPAAMAEDASIAASRASALEAGAAAGQGDFQSVLDRVHERTRNADSRDGILAEERLYSNFNEELIIRDFFQDRREGFYLDVGCAGPIKGSNTYYLEKHLGWTGIGVDALDGYAAAWKEMRPKSRFLRHLVSNRSDESQTFFKSWGLGLSSTNREWATGKAFGENFPTEEIETTTITLNDLLEREGVTKIDLMSMDIEGHESRALAGFDIERFQPELVVIEGQIAKPKIQAIASYFEWHGYARIEKYRAFDIVNEYYQRVER
ncbi:MAG: FkbM family methyltransferase [Myxococcales bacterium]|nr:FkbM family methyltransferase [Myxococcales bacterium]HIK84101.1 FkbM family methyltransferase [Myxococcales bacterium]